MKDVDTVMSEGLGMRYAFLGPLETAHLNAEGMYAISLISDSEHSIDFSMMQYLYQPNLDVVLFSKHFSNHIF